MTELKGRKPSRRVMLINPRFQLSFMAMMIGLAFAAIGIFFLANNHFFQKFNQQGKALGLPGDHVYFQFIAEQQGEMNVIFGITAGVTFVLMGVIGLIMSHRVAGPMYRLKKHLTSVADGETLADVNFRKNDYFPEVADAYNKQLARFRGIAEEKSSKKAA